MEKLLHLDGKPAIEQYGIEPFIKKCKESVWKYQHEWEEMSDRVAFWADMEHPYVTYHNDYIESEWWSLKEIWKKGLLYKGFKVVPYCPRCGTALSSHEVAQGYKEVSDTSAFVRFRVKGREHVEFGSIYDLKARFLARRLGVGEGLNNAMSSSVRLALASNREVTSSR